VQSSRSQNRGSLTMQDSPSANSVQAREEWGFAAGDIRRLSISVTLCAQSQAAIDACATMGAHRPTLPRPRKRRPRACLQRRPNGGAPCVAELRTQQPLS